MDLTLETVRNGLAQTDRCRPRAEPIDGATPGVSQPGTTEPGIAESGIGEVARDQPERELQAEPSGKVLEAAVAMVFRQREHLEVLLIERAVREGDRWSGQVAMPGGRRDLGDPDLLETAIRETDEEVGLRLSRKRWIGRLGQHVGQRLSSHSATMIVSGHAFAVERTAEVGQVQVAEVAGAFWVPLACLLDPSAAVHYRFQGLEAAFPGILLPDGRNVLWGLTYRFVNRVLEACNTVLPLPDDGSLMHRSN